MDDFGPAVPIRLDGDLDRPLYRIFPLWHFEDMLRVKRLVLVSPNLWEDPREDIPASIMMQRPDHKQKELNGYLHPARCQCWSFEGKSDSLLRAYSRVTIDPLHGRNSEPRNEGVMVRTTPRKLNRALSDWAGRVAWGKFYLGRVEYLEEEDACQKVVNNLANQGPVNIGRGENRAQSLLLKRKAFSHEDEVRLIWVCDDKREIDKAMTVNINPNDFIEEVTFDPRLVRFELVERQQRAKALGYTGALTEPDLYQKTFFQTMLPWNWEDWEHSATAK
ncbi:MULTISPECIES: hypothetical protein [unclassified Sphingopyxis]|jgi:hypothetical protein|uniref:hypothetical protein n=1 Tax=unclassified Sphingopyxis TaxID=2614943 RepID=UPI00285699E6|nr:MULTISPECIES: hypothetical protein [unclassified Sphingopyxis]MDR6834249.1 hypothetical protein [Sphingopyxis sp. BE122]MDR7226518.1 hypothetical protein [Sphingopyxis sp. BE259]